MEDENNSIHVIKNQNIVAILEIKHEFNKPDEIFDTLKHTSDESSSNIKTEEETDAGKYNEDFCAANDSDSEHDIELIKSNKGGLKLCHKGHMYTKKKVYKHSITWKCCKSFALQCKATATSDLDVTFCKTKIPHCHEANPVAIDAAKAYTKIKEIAMESCETPSDIVASSLGTEDSAVRSMINTENVKRTIRYFRSRKRPSQIDIDYSEKKYINRRKNSNPKRNLEGLRSREDIFEFPSDMPPSMLSFMFPTPLIPSSTVT